MGEQLPTHVWLRVAGGGVTMPSGRSYTTMVGDDREQPRHVEYVRADHSRATIAALVGALEACEEYFDKRSDVKDGDYGIPEPNREMVLLSEVRAALQLARGEKGDE